MSPKLNGRCADTSHSMQSAVDFTMALRLSFVNGQVSCQSLDFPGRCLLCSPRIKGNSNLA